MKVTQQNYENACFVTDTCKSNCIQMSMNVVSDLLKTYTFLKNILILNNKRDIHVFRRWFFLFKYLHINSIPPLWETLDLNQATLSLRLYTQNSCSVFACNCVNLHRTSLDIYFSNICELLICIEFIFISSYMYV